MKNYTKEIKQEIIRMRIEEGRTVKSLSEEFKVARSTINKWVKEYNEECQQNPQAKEERNIMEENLRLKKELSEMQKEILFLKKAAAFFAKEID